MTYVKKIIPMKDSDRRMKNIFMHALPIDNDHAMKRIRQWNEREKFLNITGTAQLKEKYKLAVQCLECQNFNGLPYANEKEVRHYLREFNVRAWRSGILSMPAMFNIFEAFFEYSRELIYFALLEEESYILSLYDYLDYIMTGNRLQESTPINDVEGDLIYHFTFPLTENALSFRSKDGYKYIIGNSSLVKRGSEAYVVLHTGKHITREEEAELVSGFKNKEEMLDFIRKNPRKRNIDIHEDREGEVVKFLGQEDLWYTIFAVKFDLVSNKMEKRYIANDLGTHYQIRNDDLTSFTNLSGSFKDEESAKLFADQYVDVENAEEIFELTKLILHIPYYLAKNDDNLQESLIPTSLNTVIKGPLTKRKYRTVPNKYKIFSKPIYILPSADNPIPDLGIKIRDDRYTVIKDGFYREINPQEHGTDKDGNPILGTTWVETTEVFFRDFNEQATGKSIRRFDNPESGYIYVMRKPMMDEGIFKIGLTKRTVEERRKEFSGTNTLESFQVVFSLETRDCRRAEKLVHQRLADYRISERKEFFKVNLEEAVKVVKTAVNEVNTTHN